MAEIAYRRDVNLSFTESLKAGPLITVFSLAIGIAWLVWVFSPPIPIQLKPLPVWPAELHRCCVCRLP